MIRCPEQFHKNEKPSEIKSHHYILSFDPKDKEDNGLTGEEAQRMGLDFARQNFSGHQTLVCTHTDGYNDYLILAQNSQYESYSIS
jgi:hypothetical protein